MRAVGNSDLRTFPIALGGNTFGWTSDRAASEMVLDAYAAAGGNFIDTADGYSAWAPGNAGGESETIIGGWLQSRGNRGSMVVATKAGTHPQYQGLAPATVAAAADASLQRLKTDYIDLYYAHFDDPTVPLVDTLTAFEDLRTAGKIRHIGVSNYSPERLAEWVRVAEENGFTQPVALQPHYNLVARRDFEQALAPLARAHGWAVFPFWSMASGFLTGKYRSAADAGASVRGAAAAKYFTEEGFGVIAALDSVAAARGISITTAALAWLLARPGITAALASARTVEQLPDLIAAAETVLTPEETAALDAASASFA
ncbi:aldo/keto reductase [Arthrobacter sp. I2-34]|uniref:Aldo/keto reductase n=1 Tax=Arthrobacter hankyongi TaxID=2904801 RepID=A0ABS9L4C6_9MICC|nr:aldo/keto reductase [Arthrobacter hankyongi]MCG2621471.1 aldo/keto reductase [Arthrobacter hankyongi]